MLKAGGYALMALGIFALVFAFLPVGEVGTAQTGATLSGVSLSLYPARDTDAVWKFRAASVTNNPLTGETRLTQLADGGRWIAERNKAGQLTGRQVLDATLAAPDLTIDAQDNMITRQARVTLVKECADIQLNGTAEQPVRVDQGVGFSATIAEVDSPFMKANAVNLRMSFQFDVSMDNDRSSTDLFIGAKETCVNGKRVPKKPL